MPELATETANKPTEAAPAVDATATTLLGGAADAKDTTQQQQPAAPAADGNKPAADATKPADAKPAADAKPGEAKPAEGAPEKYEFKAPEGQTYDSQLLEAFEAGVRKANLPQAAAQELLDQMAPKMAERQAEQVTAIREGWLTASKADKEFGGDQLEANLAVAKKALDTFGSPELSKLLASTGLGNHPELIRMMFKAGKALSEDSFVAGSAPTQSRPNAAAVLYDNTK